MQELSLQNLFPVSGRGNGGMQHLESGFDGKSRISRRDNGSSFRQTIGGGLPQFSDGHRLSEINMPIM